MSAEIIEKILRQPITNLVMKKKRLPNVEVVRLYREVFKYAGKFQWNNEKGQPWKEILRKSARREFDLSKSETDPFLIMKMMVTTRECVAQMDDKINQAQVALVNNIDNSRTDDQQQFTRRSKVYR